MILTFELGIWVLRMTDRLTVLHICAKLFENPSMDNKDMDRTRKIRQTDRMTMTDRQTVRKLYASLRGHKNVV